MSNQGASAVRRRQKRGRTKNGRFAKGHTHSLRTGYRGHVSMAKQGLAKMRSWLTQEQPAEGKPVSEDVRVLCRLLGVWEAKLDRHETWLSSNQVGVSSPKYGRVLLQLQTISNAILRALDVLDATRQAEAGIAPGVRSIVFGGRYRRDGGFLPGEIPTLRIIRDDSGAPHTLAPGEQPAVIDNVTGEVSVVAGVPAMRPLQLDRVKTREELLAVTGIQDAELYAGDEYISPTSSQPVSEDAAVATGIPPDNCRLPAPAAVAVDVLEPEPEWEPAMVSQWSGGSVGSIRTDYGEVLIFSAAVLQDAVMVGTTCMFQRDGRGHVRSLRRPLIDEED